MCLVIYLQLLFYIQQKHNFSHLWIYAKNKYKYCFYFILNTKGITSPCI